MEGNTSFVGLSKKTIFLIIVIICILFFNVLFSIWLSKATKLKVPSIGTIKTVGIEAYWDLNLAKKMDIIDWDIIWLGSTKNVTYYLRSTSNVPIILVFNSTDWTPIDILNYVNLTWNYYGKPINPGEIIQVTMTLSFSPTTRFVEYILTSGVNEFSFDIVIRALE